MKRSETEVTINSNIVSLENIKELKVDESAFYKTTTKRGKLFRGPNWTAYNKENLGSIPRTIEKSIVEDKKNISKVGFSTQSERFFPSKDRSEKNNPGPGSYNITGDLDFTRTSTSFYSSKGFGNGFVSATERFDDHRLFYCKYSPGPGQYQTEDVQGMSYNVNKSIFNKSLYTNKRSNSLKIKKDTPGPGQYDPLYKTFDNKFRYANKKQDAVFKSKVQRFYSNSNERFKYSIPGPGEYFKDKNINYANNNFDRNYNNDPQKNSYYFKSHSPKKIDEITKLNSFDIRTSQKPSDARFTLVDKKGRIINSQTNNIYTDIIKTLNRSNSVSSLGLSKKDIYKLRNRGFIKESYRHKNINPNFIMANGGLENEHGMEYIHKILQKPTKPNLFELNSARWKVSELVFKVPGPAYYHPKVLKKTLSFNKNTTDFIWTPGVPIEGYPNQNDNNL